MYRNLEVYREWLMRLVDNGYLHDFQYLMDIMLNTEYRSDDPRSEDRAADGLNLRENFLEWHGYSSDFLREMSPNCSFLEAIVALFTRYSDNVLVEPGDESVAPELFLAFLKESGLDFYDDSTVCQGDLGRFRDDILCKLDNLGSGKACILPVNCKLGKRFRSDWWYLTGKFGMNLMGF